MIISKAKNLTITDNGGLSVVLADVNQLYILNGTPTLTQSWTLSASGTPVEPMVIHFLWRATPNFAGQQVTILGARVPDSLTAKEFYAIAVYSAGAWNVSMFADLHQTAGGDSFGGDLVNLISHIDNTHVDAAAGIEYSKLDLADGIVDADVAAAAGFQFSKMEALTASKGIGLDGSGKVVVLTTTTAELNFIAGLTSAVQTQLNAKLESVGNGDVDAAAGIEMSKLEALTASKVIVTDGSGFFAVSAVTATEVAHLSGVTSAIQTQLNAKQSNSLARGSVLVGSGAAEAAPIDASGAGEFLIGNGSDLAAQAMSGDGTLASDGEFTIGANAATPSKVSADVRTEMLFVNASFESGFTGDKKIRIPFKCELTHIYVCVESTIEATDAGVVHLEDHASNNMSGGILSAGDLSITGGTAAGQVLQSDVSGNNAFAANEVLTIETRKSTAGGTVWITIELTKVD